MFVYIHRIRDTEYHLARYGVGRYGVGRYGAGDMAPARHG